MEDEDDNGCECNVSGPNWSDGIGCLWMAIAASILIWAASGFPKFW